MRNERPKKRVQTREARKVGGLRLRGHCSFVHKSSYLGASGMVEETGAGKMKGRKKGKKGREEGDPEGQTATTRGSYPVPPIRFGRVKCQVVGNLVHQEEVEEACHLLMQS